MRSGAGVSRYLRLYRVLSQALAEGRFGAGEPMPSEPRLMKDYGVSRSTVRRALAQLEAEERIDRRRGSGTFAREQKEEAAASRNVSPMLDGAGRQTAAATSRTIASRPVPTPVFLLDGQAELGTSVHLVRRIRYVEREPVALESAYLPRQVGSGLTRRRLGAGGSGILTLLASLGHHSASLEREFVALEADPLAADSLKLAVGAPVFSVRTLARDRQHRLLACVDCVYRPDRYEANVAIELGDPKGRRRTDGDN